MKAVSEKKNTKFVLWLMLLVTLGPMLFAIALFKKSNALELRLSNHGDLITTPLNIENILFHNIRKKSPFLGKELLGKWWLVYLSPQQCYQECQKSLYDMRQLKTALGRDASRLEPLFIQNPACSVSICEKYLDEHPNDMLKLRLAPEDFLMLFPGNQSETEILGAFYIIDPKGNIMMHYNIDAQARDILSDLKRLLKLSKIG